MPGRKKQDKREQMKRALQKRAKRLARLRPMPALCSPDDPTILLSEGDGKVTVLPGHGEKMSEVLKEFIAPYVDACQDPRDFQDLVATGAVAWNAAALPPEEREKIFRANLDKLPPEMRAGFLARVEELIQRKQKLFAHNKRFIIDYTLTPDPSGPPHLQVRSTPSEEDISQLLKNRPS